MITVVLETNYCEVLKQIYIIYDYEAFTQNYVMPHLVTSECNTLKSMTFSCTLFTDILFLVTLFNMLYRDNQFTTQV
jgi:hypothetical protein